MKEIYKDLIYLLSCAVNSITPDTERVQAMNLEQLYQLAKFHTVRAAVCIALEKTGVHEPHFHESYKKAVRKNIYLDMERTAIISAFEKQEIWYMPIKGSILKELYPENGMRQMSDNDILYDSTKQQTVMDIMLEKGYTAEVVGKSNQDVYKKPPVLNFELHTALFGEQHAEPLYRYYADIQRLLIKDEGNSYGYHFSDEDFYVYMTAHEWSHYNGSGTGIRSLLDCYVYRKNKGNTLDWNYIMEQCKQLEIDDFEQERRQLAVKVFSSDTLPDLTDAETEMLMYYLTSGTYGTFDNSIKKKLQDQSKAKYIINNMFPKYDYLKRAVPFVGKCPALYPVGVLYRWGCILVKSRDLLKRTVKAVNKYGK